MVEISLVGGVAFAGLASALLLLAWLRRIRARVRRGARAEGAAGEAALPGSQAEPRLDSPPDSQLHSGPDPRLGPRLEAIETRLARLAAEMAEGSAEARLRDMSSRSTSARLIGSLSSSR